MREKRTNGEVTCGKEETSHLKCRTKSSGERENWREKEKKERKERRGVRSSTLSLDFMEIGPSLEQKTKFNHATRASRGYKNSGFLSNSER